MASSKGNFMNDHKLWSREIEKKFFEENLKRISINNLFYKSEDGNYYAFWPKTYVGKKSTLQSRNSYVGKYTEKFVLNLFSDFAKHLQRDQIPQPFYLPELVQSQL